MSEKEPLNTQEQPLKGKWIPVLWDEEKRELLEKITTSELLAKEESLKHELTTSRGKDWERFMSVNGSVSLKNSISNWTLQIEEELDLIDKVIQNKAKTIQDAAQYNGVPPTDKDVRDLFVLIRPDGSYDDRQARFYFRDYIVSQTSSFPRRGVNKIPILNLDELMSCMNLPISKNDPHYAKYQQIIAVLLTEWTSDEMKFTGKDDRREILEVETAKLWFEQLSILEQIRLTWDQNDIASSLISKDTILDAIGTSKDYNEARSKLEWEEFWLKISQEQYDMLEKSARSTVEYVNQASERLQENKGNQIAALEKWNLVEALQQETKYQRETSQIEYYRDLRSSLSKTEWSTTNNNPPAFRNGINVNETNFSQNLEYFMNDERTNAIYPKLSDGTNIPIRKAWDDIYLVQGCQVPADEVAWLVQLNEALAEKGLRFFSTKSPLTKILSNIEQTLRTKGVQNVPHFWDLKNVSTYQDNIVDILYTIIDPDPKTPSPNVNERIDLTSKRLKNGIPLIAHGRQSWVVREDSSIDLDKIAEKLTTVIQSGYPFMFWGDKKERG